uniref:Uncharacterized protein n=1 Tax=Pyricularia oryzae (strain P131) TaxID=1143193 RepID=L7IX20_PYRO1
MYEFWEHNLVAPVPGLPTTASNFGYATAITFVLYPTVPYPRYLTQGTTAERVECSNSRNRARSPRYRKQARYFAGTARSTAQAGAYEGMHQHCAKYSYDTDEAPAGHQHDALHGISPRYLPNLVYYYHLLQKAIMSSKDERNGSKVASSPSSSDPHPSAESELAKALQELSSATGDPQPRTGLRGKPWDRSRVQGEQAASSIEEDLSKLEAKLDAMLAALEPQLATPSEEADKDSSREEPKEPQAK